MNTAKTRKIRLDVFMVMHGLADTRAKAQALIGAGLVYQEEVKLDKAGHSVAENSAITVRQAEHPWVSRGGMKLAHALEHFQLNPQGLVCLDIGASTGGFTHVLLSKGAARVYAVDVGHGQLDWGLRQHPHVIVLEKTNARYLSAEHIPEAAGAIVCDASFISLKTVLPAALELAAPGAFLVALIKPQFEAGRGKVGKGGVVRDVSLHEAICADIAAWVGGLPGWRVIGVAQSPIKGPKGNTEFLLAATYNGPR